MQYLLTALTYGIHVDAPTQIYVKQKQIAWLERRLQTRNSWRFKNNVLKALRLFTVWGTKRQASFFLIDESWLKIFVDGITSKTAQTCTLKSATSYFAAKVFTVVKSENWTLSQWDEFLSEPVVEIIGINWAKVIMHSSSI